MARKAKDNPTNMADEDVADQLRQASSDLVDAQEALEAARAPIKEAKGLIKATGIDFDIFRLCHGIRHLDDDAQRQKRIKKLHVAMHALLGDVVKLDLFGFTTSIKPAVKKALQQASDDLAKAEPPAPPPEMADADETNSSDAPDAEAPPQVPDDEPVSEDPPPLVAAEDMPEGAGFAFNNGKTAGRQGHGPDANPHDAETPEHGLWERGRAAGAAWAARFYNGETAESGGHAVMCQDEGGIVVFRHADAELVARCADALNAAQAAADEMLSPAQIRDVVHPCLADPEGNFGVVFEGKFAPDAEEQAPAAPTNEKVKFTGSAKQQRIEAYFFGYDGAAAGTPLEVLTKGRRGEPKAKIEAGYRDQQAGTEPKHERPAVKAPAEEQTGGEAAETAADAEGQGEADATEPNFDDQGVTDADNRAEPTDEPGEADQQDTEEAGQAEVIATAEPETWDPEQGRVGVQQDGATGQWVMFDLKERQPLVDAPGPNSGETWANQINGYFADCLGDVPRAELITAAKTLAMGRLLSAARPAPTDSNMFAAV
ncbi:hypothetical protein D3869_01520 [Azospirillum brasilense]|uniref:Uncharacterized protein n=1 Tax=Azospirillum brasilense TaxID=192 RepID=A0A4D8QYG4_AZOBR|nr:hypothetical protein [Azospirillum brasilense]QCO14014.1 hypothetical protein D3869_01520 [Azospirillum brasilense]